MADALAYADAQLDPTWLVDVATLTGAARIALGRAVAPVFSTDAGLTDALVAAGATTGETLWPMPLPDTYRRALDSDVADLNHIAPVWGAARSRRPCSSVSSWVSAGGRTSTSRDGPLGRRRRHLRQGGDRVRDRLLLRWLEEMA